MLRRQGGQPLHPLNIPSIFWSSNPGALVNVYWGDKLGRGCTQYSRTLHTARMPKYMQDRSSSSTAAPVSADVRLVQGKCIRPGVFWLEHSWWPSGAFEPTFEPTIDLTFWPLPPCIGIANLITFPLVSNESRRLRLQFGLTFDPRCRCQRLPSGAPGSPASRMQGTPIVTQ